MNPPFGKSTVYFRVRQILKDSFLKAKERVKKFRVPKPTLGSVWLRLSYFENRLHKLDEDNQEIFIENFYHSVRQVNYMTLLIVLVIILTYVTTLEFSMLGFWQSLGLEGILVFTLFYIVWYYRMGMEDLMDYLISQETVPDYAFRPRLGQPNLSRPLFRPKKDRASGKKQASHKRRNTRKSRKR